MPPAVKRRLVTLAAAASLVLCVATMALWVRSYFIADEWYDSRPDRYDSAWSLRGIIFIQHTTLQSEPVAPLGVHYSSDRLTPPPPSGRARSPDPGTVRDLRFLGFQWFVSRGGTGPSLYGGAVTTAARWRVAFPLWFIAILFSLLPLRWIMRTRPPKIGSCPNCRYDLRATPDRCPECGAAPAATAAR
jgi:hypothetical protein